MLHVERQGIFASDSLNPIGLCVTGNDQCVLVRELMEFRFCLPDVFACHQVHEEAA